MKEKVVIGLSGGVDSSVAAYLLKEQGYEVLGVTMQIWQDEKEFEKEEKEGCGGITAVEDARRVASQLGISHSVLNFKPEFKAHVMDYFVEEYLRGRTPNPCNACNRYVKWEALLKRAGELGADYIATGHYARIVRLPNGRYTIKTSVTAAKDQTYALYNLTQAQLSHTLMPVGAYSKEEIRAIAEDIGLSVARKADSQEICFIPDHDYAAFIEREAGERVPPKGNYVDKDGNILGQHEGITHYTIGQRKGLGIALGKHVFVTEIRPKTNEVVLGNHEDVFGREVFADHVNLMSVSEIEGKMRFTGKIRYAHKGAPCTVEMTEPGVLHCTFDEPQRAVTPGQALVLYDGDVVAGGGLIR